MSRYRFVAVALALFVLTAAVSTRGACAEESAAGGNAAKVERGRYLVVFGGCNDCHTPWILGENGPEPDMTRMLSGHPAGMALPPAPQLPEPWVGAVAATNTAWSGPWGVSFTKNLTPDKETGLGGWTEKEFIDTLRNGRERGIGREILPPMPWPGYGKASDEDLSAIWAYLQTIPAISNRVPDPLPPAASAAKE